MKNIEKILLVLFLVFGLSFQGTGQVANKKEDKKNLKTIAEKETKLKNIK